MRVITKVLNGGGRAYLGAVKDNDNIEHNKFYKAIPRFMFSLVRDDGTPIDIHRYTRSAHFGPELERVLKEEFPNIANSFGEGLTYEADFTDSPRLADTDKGIIIGRLKSDPGAESIVIPWASGRMTGAHYTDPNSKQGFVVDAEGNYMDDRFYNRFFNDTGRGTILDLNKPLVKTVINPDGTEERVEIPSSEMATYQTGDPDLIRESLKNLLKRGRLRDIRGLTPDYFIDQVIPSNMIYSPTEEDDAIRSNKKTAANVLTNILNSGSLDFNNIFGPYAEFIDPNWNGIEGSPRRISDYAVPRKDKETGEVLRDPKTGRVLTVRVPRILQTALYNMNTPGWSDLWNSVNDYNSFIQSLLTNHTAPSSVDYKGNVVVDKTGKPIPFQYGKEAARIASRPGYFTRDKVARNALIQIGRDMHGFESLEKINDARSLEAAKMAAKQFNEYTKNHIWFDTLSDKNDAGKTIDYESYVNARRDEDKHKALLDMNSPKVGKKLSAMEMRAAYFTMLKNASKVDGTDATSELFSSYGLSDSDLRSLLNYVRIKGFNEYNRIGNDEDRVKAILDDYTTDLRNFAAGKIFSGDNTFSSPDVAKAAFAEKMDEERKRIAKENKLKNEGKDISTKGLYHRGRMRNKYTVNKPTITDADESIASQYILKDAKAILAKYDEIIRRGGPVDKDVRLREEARMNAVFDEFEGKVPTEGATIGEIVKSKPTKKPSSKQAAAVDKVVSAAAKSPKKRVVVVRKKKTEDDSSDDTQKNIIEGVKDPFNG